MRRDWQKGRSRLCWSIFVSICIWVNRSNIKNSLGKIWCPVSLSTPTAHLRLTSARAPRRSFSTPIAGIGLTLALLTEVDSGFKSTIDFCQQSECKPNTSNHSSWIWKTRIYSRAVYHISFERAKKVLSRKKNKLPSWKLILIVTIF